MLEDRNEYLDRLEIKDSQLTMYKSIVEVMENDMSNCLTLKDSINIELKEVIVKHNDLTIDYSKLEKQNRILRVISGVSVPVAIGLIILLAL